MEDLAQVGQFEHGFHGGVHAGQGEAGRILLRELQTLTEIAREKNLIIVPGGEIGTMAGLAKAVTKKTEQ